jgi:hypothetical protein
LLALPALAQQRPDIQRYAVLDKVGQVVWFIDSNFLPPSPKAGWTVRLATAADLAIPPIAPPFHSRLEQQQWMAAH